jgi:hypothetical protein
VVPPKLPSWAVSAVEVDGMAAVAELAPHEPSSRVMASTGSPVDAKCTQHRNGPAAAVDMVLSNGTSPSCAMRSFACHSSEACSGPSFHQRRPGTAQRKDAVSSRSPWRS